MSLYSFAIHEPHFEPSLDNLKNLLAIKEELGRWRSNKLAHVHTLSASANTYPQLGTRAEVTLSPNGNNRAKVERFLAI